MTTENSIRVLTDDESSIIELLQHIYLEADEFDDPENGDYLERLEALFRNATEVDATVVKIALDRTHFFMGGWNESSFSGNAYEVIPASSPATDHLRQVLDPVNVTEATGLKAEILKIVDSLQVTYFWRDSDNPNSEILRKLIELVADHNIKDEALTAFVQWSILFPWNEHIGIQFVEVPKASKHFEWQQTCAEFNALR